MTRAALRSSCKSCVLHTRIPQGMCLYSLLLKQQSPNPKPGRMWIIIAKTLQTTYCSHDHLGINKQQSRKNLQLQTNLHSLGTDTLSGWLINLVQPIRSTTLCTSLNRCISCKLRHHGRKGVGVGLKESHQFYFEVLYLDCIRPRRINWGTGELPLVE